MYGMREELLLTLQSGTVGEGYARFPIGEHSCIFVDRQYPLPGKKGTT